MSDQATPAPQPPERRPDRRVERRRSCHVAVSCQARLVGDAFGQPWPASLSEVSHEGFRLHAQRPLSVGAELAVHLPELPGLRGGRRVLARVVHAGRAQRRGGYTFGCALVGGELSPLELSALILAAEK
jgi:hypothetical protein